VLSRDVAQRGRYPAIDVTRSISRLTSALVSEPEKRLVADAVKALALYETSRDLIEVGAYRAGTSTAVDRAIRLVPELEQFLAQRPEESESRTRAMERLRTILAGQEKAA
jgi:flagellum-specific ATP synthase